MYYTRQCAVLSRESCFSVPRNPAPQFAPQFRPGCTGSIGFLAACYLRRFALYRHPISSIFRDWQHCLFGSGCGNIRVRVACLRGAGFGRRGIYCYIERVWASMEEKNTTPLTQDEVQPIQIIRKNHWKSLVKFVFISAFFMFFGFFLHQLIGGKTGLIIAIIIYIFTPALGITFSWGSKKEETKTLLLQVQEYAESRGITVKEFVRIYENMRLSVKIVPKTFLVMGIILLLGGFSFCVFCVFLFHYIFNNQLISIYNEQWNDTIKSLVFGITFLLCGILYIICYARKRKIPCKTFRVLTVILIPAIPILTLIGVPLFIL